MAHLDAAGLGGVHFIGLRLLIQDSIFGATPFVVDGVAGRRQLCGLAHDLVFLLLFFVLLVCTTLSRHRKRRQNVAIFVHEHGKHIHLAFGGAAGTGYPDIGVGGGEEFVVLARRRVNKPAVACGIGVKGDRFGSGLTNFVTPERPIVNVIFFTTDNALRASWRPLNGDQFRVSHSVIPTNRITGNAASP